MRSICMKELEDELTMGKMYTRVEDTEGHYEAIGNTLVINDKGELRAYTKHIFKELD